VTIPLASEQPTVPLWPDAAHALGIRSRQTAYRLANQGRLPVRTLQVGPKQVVPTGELRRVLQLDDPAPDVAQAG
jgi:hypothetical protein